MRNSGCQLSGLQSPGRKARRNGNPFLFNRPDLMSQHQENGRLVTPQENGRLVTPRDNGRLVILQGAKSNFPKSKPETQSRKQETTLITSLTRKKSLGSNVRRWNVLYTQGFQSQAASWLRCSFQCTKNGRIGGGVVVQTTLPRHTLVNTERRCF